MTQSTQSIKETGIPHVLTGASSKEELSDFISFASQENITKVYQSNFPQTQKVLKRRNSYEDVQQIKFLKPNTETSASSSQLSDAKKNFLSTYQGFQKLLTPSLWITMIIPQKDSLPLQYEIPELYLSALKDFDKRFSSGFQEAQTREVVIKKENGHFTPEGIEHALLSCIYYSNSVESRAKLTGYIPLYDMEETTATKRLDELIEFAQRYEASGLEKECALFIKKIGSLNLEKLIYNASYAFESEGNIILSEWNEALLHLYSNPKLKKEILTCMLEMLQHYQNDFKIYLKIINSIEKFIDIENQETNKQNNIDSIHNLLSYLFLNNLHFFLVENASFKTLVLFCLSDLQNNLQEKDPEYYSKLMLRANLKLVVGSFNEALADLNKALSIEPNNAFALASSGEIKRLQGKPDEALADLNKALSIEPNNAFALARGGEIKRFQGKPDEALADLNKALSIEPNNAFALASRGEIKRLQGKLDEALVDLNKALLLNPTSFLALAHRGEIKRVQGKLDEALADLNNALPLKPNNAFALARRGEIKRLQKKPDEALADLNKALSIEPNNAFALASRGVIKRRQGKLEEALADLNNALLFNPTSILALTHRGEMKRLEGKLDEALADLNKALSIEPNIALALSSRGDIKRFQGKLDEALADLNKALSIEPNNAFALASRGDIKRLQGKLDEALADLNKALSIEPNNAFALASRKEIKRLQENQK